MKWSICDDSAISSSSSSEDETPILPESSSDDLSTIDESRFEKDFGSDAATSSSSRYLSSLLNQSLTSNSSDDHQEDLTKKDRVVCASNSHDSILNSVSRTSDRETSSVDLSSEVIVS